MKKLSISLLVFVLILFSAICTVCADGHTYIQKCVSCPEGEEYMQTSYPIFRRLCARFADTKTPIALCDYYEGNMWVNIHQKDSERPIEVFLADEASFKDYDPNASNSFHFYVAESLYYRGVMIGNEKGELLPENAVTRAEATAMILRFLGLEPETYEKSVFEDVPQNAWYCNTVQTAFEYGIVAGDSNTTFSPDRLVTREELVSMAARAAVFCELRYMSSITSHNEIRSSYAREYDWKDRISISPWAICSYDTVYHCLLSDMTDLEPIILENGEMEFPVERHLNPKKYATRYEVADLLTNIMDYYLLFPSQDAIKFGFDKNMPTIDGSTSTYPFTDAVYASLFMGGFYHPQKPEKHSKSHISYQKLINGEVDMIFASVYPSSDILALAKENGVEIELIPIAYDAMIFFTNADNPLKGLTKEQISDIYVNNAYTNWKELGGNDAILVPYCRNNDSGSHAQMEKHFLNGKQIHEKIQKETTSVTMSNVLTDVMAAKSEEPLSYGLGYSIYYYFNNMDLFYNTKSTLKLLEIDGIAPNDETIADGSYPLSNNTYIAILKDTPKDAPARKMAEFMLTQSGQDCVEQAGFGRLIKN